MLVNYIDINSASYSTSQVSKSWQGGPFLFTASPSATPCIEFQTDLSNQLIPKLIPVCDLHGLQLAS